MHEDDGVTSDADTVVPSPLTCSRRRRKCSSHNQSDQLLVDACGTVSLSKRSLELSPSVSEACTIAPRNGCSAAEGAPYEEPRHVVHLASSSSAYPAAEAANTRPPGFSQAVAQGGVRRQKRMSLKERIDAQRAGYDSPLQLVPERQAFPGAGDAEAGCVSRDVVPLRLNAALQQGKILSFIYLLGVLMALVWIVTLFRRMVDRIERTSARGLGLLCDAVPAGVAGAGNVGVCKFSLW
jgi:hypothetical protein